MKLDCIIFVNVTTHVVNKYLWSCSFLKKFLDVKQWHSQVSTCYETIRPPLFFQFYLPLLPSSYCFISKCRAPCWERNDQFWKSKAKLHMWCSYFGSLLPSAEFHNILRICFCFFFFPPKGHSTNQGKI